MKNIKSVAVLFLILSFVILLFAYLKMNDIFYNPYVLGMVLLFQFATLIKFFIELVRVQRSNRPLTKF